MHLVVFKALQVAGISLPGLIGLFLIARAFVDGNTADARYGIGLMGILGLSLFIPGIEEIRSRTRYHAAAVILLLVSVLAILPFTVVVLIFGKVDMASFVFHLVFGVEGTPWNDILPYVFTAVVLWSATLVSFFRLRGMSKAKDLLTLASVLPMIAANPLVHDLGVNRASALLGPKMTVLDEFHEPKIIDALHKPNLVIIYLEGFDRGYMDTERFGDMAAELADLEKQAISFHNLRQVEATGWSLAGTVATQCGAPLLPFGAKPLSETSSIPLILPKLTCLPDILVERGYDIVYMSGAKIRGNTMGYYGFDNYLETHGGAEIEDRDTIKNARTANIGPDDWDDWGVFDSELLDGAREVITAKSRQDRPFAVFIATMDTHGPKAMISPACTSSGKPEISEDMQITVRCVSKITTEFVKDLRENWGDDLKIAIFSDHLNHSSNLTKALELKPRVNTAMLLGSDLAPQAIHREGSMLDLYPTLLGWLGLLDPQEPRAGLGVSLLSDMPTLVEKRGFDGLNRILRVDTTLSRHIWRTENAGVD